MSGSGGTCATSPVRAEYGIIEHKCVTREDIILDKDIVLLKTCCHRYQTEYLNNR